MRKEYRLLQEVEDDEEGTAGTGNFWLYKKSSKNPIVRSVAKKGLEYVPGIYHNLTKRVKNKTLKRILNSAIKTADQRLNISRYKQFRN